MDNKKGMLIIISGPAGCGKDTIVQKLFQQPENKLVYSVTMTTREIRPGEINGEHYYFTTEEKFEKLIEAGEFLEHTKYCGNYYGTNKKTVLSAIESGKSIVLKIEGEGAGNIKRQFPEALLIFIMPPSLEELRRRLINRGTEDALTIEERLKKAQIEISGADKYDYRVMNDDLQTAVEEVAEIIRSHKKS